MAMSSPWPSVSVVICAYNYERFVAESVDSALAQEYPADRLEIDRRRRRLDRRNAGHPGTVRRPRPDRPSAQRRAHRRDDARHRGEHRRPDRDPGRRRRVAPRQAAPPGRAARGAARSRARLLRQGDGRRARPAHRARASSPTAASRTRRRRDSSTTCSPSTSCPRPRSSSAASTSGASFPSPRPRRRRTGGSPSASPRSPCSTTCRCPLVRYRVHGSNMGIGSKRGEAAQAARRLPRLPALEPHAPRPRHGAARRPARRLAALSPQRLPARPRERPAARGAARGRSRPRAAAAASVGRAVEAFGAGDANTAFRHLLAARVADPFDGDVRERLRGRLRRARGRRGRRAARGARPLLRATPTRSAATRLDGDRIAAGFAAEAAHELQALEQPDRRHRPCRSGVDRARARRARGGQPCRRGPRRARRAARRRPRRDVLRALGRAAAAVGDLRSAVHWAGRATAVAPDDAGAWRELGARAPGALAVGRGRRRPGPRRRARPAPARSRAHAPPRPAASRSSRPSPCGRSPTAAPAPC